MASRFSAANASIGSRGGGSIYFDAYTGEDDVDAQVKFRNMIVADALNVTEDGKKQKIETVQRKQSF